MHGAVLVFGSDVPPRIRTGKKKKPNLLWPAWDPFLRSFPGNEAHTLFSGAHHGVFWMGELGGGQKVYVEKVCALFLSPKGMGVFSAFYTVLTVNREAQFRFRFPKNGFDSSGSAFVGFGKGVFWKRGLFRKVHFLEILEKLESLEFLKNPQTVENKGDSDHFLEILENLEILEILESSPVERPLS